jgi:hypothetical protein
MKKLSKSEAGKLGAFAGIAYMQKVKENNRKNYLVNPSKCRECLIPLPYEKKKYIFCSHNCSAKHNNNRYGTGKPKTVKLSREEINKERVEKGLCCWRIVLKRYIIKYVLNNKPHCEICNLEIWNKQPIPLELDHIDGDAGNNFPKNLRLLCPNCHAQTPTAKGKNKGKGRKSRGIRY